MTWNASKSFVTIKGLKEAYEQKNGNSGEINLILTAMLREAGFESNPVLLATRDYGIPVFPSLQGFNYVIASVHLNGKDLLYDATEKYAIRDVLPLRAINWNGKLVKKDYSYKEIELFPEKTSQLEVNIKAEVFKDGHLEGTTQNNMSQQYMLVFRGLKEIDFQDDYKKILESIYQIEIDEWQDNSQNKTDTIYTESYRFSADNQTDVIGNKIYISPLLFHAFDENPFKSKEREYPIDFVFPKTENYQISFTLPEGYKVVHLPEPISVKFVDNLAAFKFQTNQSENQVTVQMQLTSTKSVVAAGYYKLFQEFYNKIIEKENDKIVLEKVQNPTKS